MKTQTVEKSGLFTFRNVAITAAVAVLAPYVIRRMLPLFTDRPEDTSARDLTIAGKDSIRDAADDLGVGGVTGKIKRGVDRVADRLN